MLALEVANAQNAFCCLRADEDSFSPTYRMNPDDRVALIWKHVFKIDQPLSALARSGIKNPKNLEIMQRFKGAQELLQAWMEAVIGRRHAGKKRVAAHVRNNRRSQ